MSHYKITLTSMAAPGFITRKISSNMKSHYRPIVRNKIKEEGGGGMSNEMSLH